MNNKFKIEFILFDKNMKLTDFEINQKNKLLHIDMKNILNLAISNLANYGICENDTDELTISCSFTKKMKLFMDIENNENQHSIFFYTCDNMNLYNFEELKKIVKKIRKEIENYLDKHMYNNGN